MAELAIACAWSGQSLDHVRKLRDAVIRHLGRPHTMVCFTDHPERCEGVTFIDTTETGLTGEWVKMLAFEPGWREGFKIIYFDLDLSIVGSIAPLADVPGEFASHDGVMVIGAGLASFVWHGFVRHRSRFIERFDRANDCIAELYPNATSLLRLMPRGFFLHEKIIGGGDSGSLHRVVIAPR